MAILRRFWMDIAKTAPRLAHWRIGNWPLYSVSMTTCLPACVSAQRNANRASPTIAPRPSLANDDPTPSGEQLIILVAVFNRQAEHCLGNEGVMQCKSKWAPY